MSYFKRGICRHDIQSEQKRERAMEAQMNLLNRNDCLLLVVDIQKSMLNTCQDAERVLARSSFLIDIAQVMGLPVILTAQNPVKLGNFMPELSGRIQNPLILEKIEFGCFENETIREAIGKTGRKTVLLAGIETHICIFQTAMQGLGCGYRLQVVADATSASDPLGHKIGLRRLERAGAVITSAEMAVYELLRRAGTLEFRNVLPIIKTLKK